MKDQEMFGKMKAETEMKKEFPPLRFQQKSLLQSFSSLTPVSSPPAHKVKEKINVLPSLPTLSTEDIKLNKEAVPSALDRAERRILRRRRFKATKCNFLQKDVSCCFNWICFKLIKLYFYPYKAKCRISMLINLLIKKCLWPPLTQIKSCKWTFNWMWAHLPCRACCRHLTDSVQRRSGTSHVDGPRGRRSEASPESPPASRWTHNPGEENGDELLLHSHSGSLLSIVGLPSMYVRHSVLQTKHSNSSRFRAAFRQQGEFSDVPLFIQPETELSAWHQKHFNNWVAPSSHFCCSYLPT